MAPDRRSGFPKFKGHFLSSSRSGRAWQPGEGCRKRPTNFGNRTHHLIISLPEHHYLFISMDTSLDLSLGDLNSKSESYEILTTLIGRVGTHFLHNINCQDAGMYDLSSVVFPINIIPD